MNIQNYLNNMNNFTDDLIVKSVSASKWQLMDPFFYYFDESDKTKGVTVPVGFITDFASTPRIIWSIIPPTGRYTKAAALHDYLYSNPKSVTNSFVKVAATFSNTTSRSVVLKAAKDITIDTTTSLLTEPSLVVTVNYNFTRKECDKILLNAMKVLGVGKLERTAMYLGVRLFGANHFNK